MTAGVEGGAHFVLKQTTYESLETRNHRERRRPLVNVQPPILREPWGLDRRRVG